MINVWRNIKNMFFIFEEIGRRENYNIIGRPWRLTGGHGRKENKG